MRKFFLIRLALTLLLTAGPGLAAAAQVVVSAVPIGKRAPMRVDADLPASVDNTLLKYFPPIIDQRGGSCAQASAIGYMFTYEMNRLLDRDASASADYRFSYQYTYNLVNEGEDSGSFGWDGLALAMANGIVTEGDFPLSSSSSFKWPNGYDKYLKAIHYRATGFRYINLDKWDDLAQVKQFLYNRGETGRPGGIVVYSAKATNWTFDDEYSGPSETGYKSLLTKLATEGGHALTIAGYDDLVEFTTPSGEVTRGAFIVVNTWGKYSHDNGRFYLPYWFFFNNVPANNLSSSVTTVDVEYREPKLVYRVGVSCDSRDDLSFLIGAASGSSASSPTASMRVSIANHQGGDYPMQGNYWPSDIEFAFDFSNMASRVEEMSDPTWFLDVERAARGRKKATQARLDRFEVYDYRSGMADPRHYVYDLFEAEEEGRRDFVSGSNLYALTSVPPVYVSCSPLVWLDRFKQPVAAPLVFRTASGKYAKVRLSSYDRENGTITLKYVYNPNGGRNVQ